MLPEASEDLIKIVEFLQKDSPTNANSVAEKLYAAIDSLAFMPHRFRIHKSTKRPSRIVRSMSVPPFIIYYRIREQELWVVVLTIRHGSQRQPRQFKH